MKEIKVLRVKTLWVFFMVSVLISACFAEESTGSFLRSLYSSSGVVIENDRNGGYGDVGFSIIEKDTWDIRNTIGLHGYGSNTYGYLGISEKVSFGGWFEKSETSYRPYGSVSVIGCLFGGSGKPLASLPVSVDILGSGGFEIMYTKNQSFFIEYGGGYRFTVPFESGRGVSFISAGIRNYFK